MFMWKSKTFGEPTKFAKSNGENYKEHTEIYLLVWDYYISKGALA